MLATWSPFPTFHKVPASIALYQGRGTRASTLAESAGTFCKKPTHGGKKPQTFHLGEHEMPGRRISETFLGKVFEYFR